MLCSALAVGCICLRVDPFPAPFPEGARLRVRYEHGTSPPEPFAACGGFSGSFGTDFCGGAWTGQRTADGGFASGNERPQLATYGYSVEYHGEVGRLCRYFGDESGDEHGCQRRDVRCASSGEIVVMDEGASVIADFEGGGRVEAAWAHRPLGDAGPRPLLDAGSR
jgi:hypothetical protein